MIICTAGKVVFHPNLAEPYRAGKQHDCPARQLPRWSHKGEPVFRLSVLHFSFSPGSYRYGYQVLPDSEISFELPHEAA